jgi:hypothetical protein
LHSCLDQPNSYEDTQHVREGDSIRLKVISTLDVKPTQVRLIHNGSPVDTKKRPNMTVDRVAPGTYNVSILNVRVADSGRYEYQVEGAPTPKHLVTLYVEPRQVKEKMLHLPQTTFNAGETVLFKVDFDEHDNINETPKWYRNEMQIPIGGNQRHKQTTDLRNRTHTFEIHNLQPEDSGSYEMRTSQLIVKTPEIKVIPKAKVDEVVPEDVSRQSSVTINMNKHQEQPL